MARVGGLLVAATLLGACATDAPEGPSPYPPTVKPTLSKLTFDGSETCERLRSRFDTKAGAEAYFAKQLAVMHYEMGFTTVLMLGVNVLAFNTMSESLAEVRGDLIALRAQMQTRECHDAPEVVFSTPSARTTGSPYH